MRREAPTCRIPNGTGLGDARNGAGHWHVRPVGVGGKSMARLSLTAGRTHAMLLAEPAATRCHMPEAMRHCESTCEDALEPLGMRCRCRPVEIREDQEGPPRAGSARRNQKLHEANRPADFSRGLWRALLCAAS